MATLGAENALEEKGRRCADVLRWYIRHSREYPPTLRPSTFRAVQQRELGILRRFRVEFNRNLRGHHVVSPPPSIFQYSTRLIDIDLRPAPASPHYVSSSSRSSPSSAALPISVETNITTTAAATSSKISAAAVLAAHAKATLRAAYRVRRVHHAHRIFRSTMASRSRRRILLSVRTATPMKRV